MVLQEMVLQGMALQGMVSQMERYFGMKLG
jgi:hypothetical protein